MACDAEWQQINTAFDGFVDAARDLEDAEDKLEDEEGFWEEETAGTGAGVLTIVGAIVAGALTGGWGGVAVFAIGSGVGTGGIIYAETDRQDDIDAARAGVTAAQKALAAATVAWDKSLGDFCRCKARQAATP